ncbi:MAG: RluA family pseudouridine synthase [Bacilli bacterium]|nr:RluA family pseudouridine synthase [Bacilli bacterium]
MNKRYVVKEKMLLFDFLRLNLKSLSKNNIKSLLLKNKIHVNNNVVTKYDYELKEEDVVEIRNTLINNDLKDIKIIYEDKDFIVVDKPSGLLTVATDKEKEKTLYNIVKSYVKEKNKNNKIFIVHRLDKDTSGVVLFSKNEKLKFLLQDKWNDITKRIYYAVVVGITKDKEILKSYLKENKDLITYSSSRGDLAITCYERVKSNKKHSLLKIDIKTGRKNQIRVQLNDIGHSILGDNKYGVKDNKFRRMMLHAESLEIIHPITNKKMKFVSSVPVEFEQLVINN